MTFSEWATEFAPITNRFDSDTHMFDTDGEQLDYVQSQDRDVVWSYVHGDRFTVITNGYASHNVIGYYITQHPYKNEDFYMVDYDEEEED
jgi:hypothetical protein